MMKSEVSRLVILMLGRQVLTENHRTGMHGDIQTSLHPGQRSRELRDSQMVLKLKCRVKGAGKKTSKVGQQDKKRRDKNHMRVDSDSNRQTALNGEQAPGIIALHLRAASLWLSLPSIAVRALWPPQASELAI